jgi:peptidyl-prolyl cis-trans isomerase-like 2
MCTLSYAYTQQSHDKRGVLAMANSGPHTVGSQFYITYSSCKHLDKKHSVFGAMVGGNAALSAIEAIATDKQDKPSRDVTLIRAVVLQNPIDEMEVSFMKLLCFHDHFPAIS